MRAYRSWRWWASPTATSAGRTSVGSVPIASSRSPLKTIGSRCSGGSSLSSLATGRRDAHVAGATGRSQLERERHGPADFFLLNVGWAVVRYGPSPFADLASEPRLYYGPEQVYITHGERRVPIQDRHLSARRAG